jgi:hypothetical protein
MSTVTLSQPHWAMTSAEKPDGIANQALTQALPAFSRALSLFMKFPLVSVGISNHQRCRLYFRQSKKRHVRFGSIVLKKAKMNPSKFLPARPPNPVFRNPMHKRELTKVAGWKSD